MFRMKVLQTEKNKLKRLIQQCDLRVILKASHIKVKTKRKVSPLVSPPVSVFLPFNP